MKIFKLIILNLLLLFFAVLFGLIIYLYWGVTEPKSNAVGFVDFQVEPGESKLTIAQNLESAGLVQNRWLVLGYWAFSRQVVKVGKYSVSPSNNIIFISDMLANAQEQEQKVLIKEGWSSWQIAQTLSDEKLADYNEALKLAKTKEGYLFPDTYRIAENSTVLEILKTFEDNFNLKTKDLKVTKESVIIASLLEREGKTLEEKQMVASVIQNRINKGMTLDLDATIQFAKGSWESIKHDDIVNTNSAYNTYKNVGLPPGPICNPGLDSIKAALEPGTSDYLFYFHSLENKAIFSKTLNEHNANIAKYGVSGS